MSRRILGSTLLALLLASATSLPIAAAEGVERSSGFVTTPDAVNIHYLEARPAKVDPAAPTLLFVPGWTLPAEIWQPQIDHFSATHRVVAMDPRSQGKSDRPDDGHYPAARGRDVKAVIDGLELAPVVPVCWSLAVGECVSMVEQFGTGDLAALVLVDGLAGGEYDPQLTPSMINWVGDLQRNRRQGTASFVRSMYRTPRDDDYLDRVTDWSLQTPTDAMVALMVGGITYDGRETLAKIDRPVLFTVSESPFTPRYEEMRDRIPEVRYEVFEAGHALFIDMADTFNNMVEELLDGLDGSDGGGGGEDPGDGGIREVPR